MKVYDRRLNREESLEMIYSANGFREEGIPSMTREHWTNRGNHGVEWSSRPGPRSMGCICHSTVSLVMSSKRWSFDPSKVGSMSRADLRRPSSAGHCKNQSTSISWFPRRRLISNDTSDGLLTTDLKLPCELGWFNHFRPKSMRSIANVKPSNSPRSHDCFFNEYISQSSDA